MRITTLTSRTHKTFALQLAWEVFLQFEAPVFEEEGIQNFHNFIESKSSFVTLNMYGAWQEDTLCGMLAIRDSTHISLFFVSDKEQHKGIGKALFHEFLKEAPIVDITVNASPYAVHIYENLGFHKLQEEQLQDGIRFTPMIYHHN